MLSATDLRITEFLASNHGDFVDADGDASDWVEIYNSGADTVALTGMYLTDSAGNKTKWAFPAGQSIAAGGYRIVFASDKDGVLAGGELHTNFKLSADGEYLGLIAADGATVIDQYTPEFPDQVEDISYGRAMQPSGATTTIIANGAQARAWVPTSSVYDATWRNLGFNDSVFNLVGPTGFGYESNPGDAVNFTAEIGTYVPNTTKSLYMRIPFSVASMAGIDSLTLRMRYDDGFVAYLNGQKIYEASAPESPQWNSSALTARDDSLAEQFTSFDVSAFIPKLRVGQNVLAIHGLNVLGSDMLISPELVSRAATIVAPTRLGYFDLPTPGYGNGSNYLGFVESPTYSVAHGFYTTTQFIGLTPVTPGSIIVYTTNGSTPAVNASLVPTNGTLYTGPITVSGTTTLRAAAFKLEYKASFIAASTYLFLNDVLTQSPTGIPPAGWPADAAVNGQEMNYGIDPDIIAQYGAQAVKDSLLSLPTISITTDLSNLFDPATGIYVNANFDGRDWERAASVELINSDGSAGFATNAGLRIRGGYSRNDFNPKHAFRLYFRGEYGDGKLNYPLFGNEGTDEFDVLDLRTEQNYSWSSDGSVENTFLREIFSRDLQRDLGDEYTRSRYYNLYVGGQYFGVFQTQERVQEDFAATYFGGAPEDYDILKAGLGDVGGTQLAEGTDSAWAQLFTLAQNLANNPAANANNYYTMQGLNPDGTRNPALHVLLDVDNLVNYMLMIFYTGGYDTGLSRFLGDNQANNWYGVYNRTTADRGFQFFMHDNEHALGAESPTVHGSQFIDRTGPFNLGNQSVYAQFNPQYLHQDLMSSPEYRQRMIEKAQQFMFGNGPMTPGASLARLQQRIVQVEPAIIAEAARWGDAQLASFASPYNKLTWQTEVNWLIGTYFPTRTATVIGQLRADGLYVTPPSFSLAAGAVPVNSSLSMAAAGGGAGTIYYTTDGVTDPRLVGGGLNGSPAVKIYSGPVSLTADQTIKARFRTTAGDWSVLVTTAYSTYLPGDYAVDGIVDGQDFLAWQQQLGSTANPPGNSADGNRDGTVEAGDLAAWQNYFGYGASAAESLAAAAVMAPPFELANNVLLAAPVPAPVAGAQRSGSKPRPAATDAALGAAEFWRPDCRANFSSRESDLALRSRHSEISGTEKPSDDFAAALDELLAIDLLS
jgi:hypothetical protein